MRTLRVAVAGTGFSATAHVEALRRLPGVEVAAILGRVPARAQEVAAGLGVPRAVASVDELLADDEIRAIHNCTPNDVHAEISATALAAGRHVLSEKPLALNAAEAEALAALAATSPGVAGVCFNYRHFPLVRQLKSMLSSGDFGPVHLVHGGYLQDWLLYETDWSWRLDPERNGQSRAVADIGSHWMDLVQYVNEDAIVEVFANLGTLHASRRPGAGTTFDRSRGSDLPSVRVETEDFGTILLRFASGATGSVTVSQVSAGRKNRLAVELSAASATFAWDQERPDELWVGSRDQPNRMLVRDPSLLVPEAAALARLPAGHPEGWADALRNLLEDFYAAVRANDEGVTYQPSFATFAEGAQLARLVEAALESHRSQGWTPVDVIETVGT